MKNWPITISWPCGPVVSGVWTWAVQLAQHLALRGREVRLVLHDWQAPATCRKGYELADLGAGKKRRFKLVCGPPLFDADQWEACYDLYRSLAPTLLLPNSAGQSYAPAAMLASEDPRRIRVIGWHHSDDPYQYSYLSHYEPIIHTFVSVSRHCAAELASRLPHRASDIAHLTCGIIIPPPQPREPLAKRPLRLVYAGRMEQHQKRIFDFVRLAQGLDERSIDFQLRLVGDGSRVAELQQQLAGVRAAFKNQRNAAWVEPPVPHTSMNEVWHWADVAVMVSEFEGLSISMLEAMACGCVPVVARVDSGVGEVLREGENGLTFPVGDIPQMVAHLESLRSNEALRARMSEAARASVSDYCGYERFLDRALQIIDRASDLPPRPWPAGRELQMKLPTEFFLPDRTVGRLRSLLQEIAEQGGGPVAIFCAGKHTRALEDVWKASAVEIVAVIDEAPKPGARLWDWPVITPDQAAASGARAVIISSWVHEAALWKRHHEALAAAGIEMHCLYTDAQSPAVAFA
jgi:glycosyltransferase involved in cell wall biosynthesis